MDKVRPRINASGATSIIPVCMPPDGGSVSLRRNVRVGYVPQQAEFPAGKTAHEVVADDIGFSENDMANSLEP